MRLRSSTPPVRKTVPAAILAALLAGGAVLAGCDAGGYDTEPPPPAEVEADPADSAAVDATDSTVLDSAQDEAPAAEDAAGPPPEPPAEGEVDPAADTLFF